MEDSSSDDSGSTTDPLVTFDQYTIQLYDSVKKRWIYSIDLPQTVHLQDDDGFYDNQEEALVSIGEIMKELQSARYPKIRLLKETFEECEDDEDEFDSINSVILKEFNVN